MGIFFVISGFLITGIILGQLGSHIRASIMRERIDALDRYVYVNR